MKRKPKKLKQSLRLHGELVASSFNELELLESRPETKSKSPLLQVLDSLSPKSPEK